MSKAVKKGFCMKHTSAIPRKVCTRETEDGREAKAAI